MLNFKILIIIGGIAGIIAILFASQGITKQEKLQEIPASVTKGNISSISNFTLPQNYTSLELLNYCSQSESHIYDDTCIRGLWDVVDNCKNENFSTASSICDDSRLDKFETKVANEMQDLGKSLSRTIDSCMVAKNNDDIQSCLVTIERIKNDCTDPHFYSLTGICNYSRLDQFIQKYNDNSVG